MTACKQSDKLTSVVKEEWLNGRAAVSKTAGCVFESCLLCQGSCGYAAAFFIFPRKTKKRRNGKTGPPYLKKSDYSAKQAKSADRGIGRVVSPVARYRDGIHRRRLIEWR